MEKKKKIFFYLSITLILALLFWFLNTKYNQDNGYNLSQQGVSENKGQFIPEQRTDYIFTTVETENNVFLIGILIIVVITIIVLRKKLRRKRT